MTKQIGGNMKRPFLCGLGFELLLTCVALLGLGMAETPRWLSIVIAIFAGLLGVWAVLVARRTPADKSWPVTILVWLCGYFAIAIIGLPLLAVFSLITGQPIRPIPIPYITEFQFF